MFTIEGLKKSKSRFFGAPNVCNKTKRGTEGSRRRLKKGEFGSRKKARGGFVIPNQGGRINNNVGGRCIFLFSKIIRKGDDMKE